MDIAHFLKFIDSEATNVSDSKTRTYIRTPGRAYRLTLLYAKPINGGTKLQLHYIDGVDIYPMHVFSIACCIEHMIDDAYAAAYEDYCKFSGVEAKVAAKADPMPKATHKSPLHKQ